MKRASYKDETFVPKQVKDHEIIFEHDRKIYRQMTTKITNSRKRLDVPEKQDRLITKSISDKVVNSLSERKDHVEEDKDSDSSDSKSGSMLSSEYAFENLHSESIQDSLDQDNGLLFRRMDMTADYRRQKSSYQRQMTKWNKKVEAGNLRFVRHQHAASLRLFELSDDEDAVHCGKLCMCCKNEKNDE